MIGIVQDTNAERDIQSYRGEGFIGCGGHKILWKSCKNAVKIMLICG